MAKSIIQDYSHKQCYLCGYLKGIWDDNQPNLEEHHIMMGPLRKKSEHYGLKVLLCPYHHRTSSEAVHQNAENEHFLQVVAQYAFEKLHSHEEWMTEFGKNYLPESLKTKATEQQKSEAPKHAELKTVAAVFEQNPFGD